MSMGITSALNYESTYEMCFDGEIGSLVSLDAFGHLTDAEVDLFMVTAIVDEVGDRDEEPLTFGIEVSHLWRVTHPFVPDEMDESDDYESRWTFSYSEEQTPGAIPVTKFEVASPRSVPRLEPNSPRLERNRRTHEFDVTGVDYFPVVCVNHPEEPATTGYPESRVIDPKLVLDGYVHMCQPCSRDFSLRLEEAYRKAREEAQ